MSAQLQHPDDETQGQAPAALQLQAVRERRLRVVGRVESEETDQQHSTARPALSLAPLARPRRHLPMIFTALVAVMIALGTVLLLNINISKEQYRLVELRTEEQQISDQNAALSEEIEYQRAPQNLAEHASTLGMVASSGQAQLDLRDGSLSGTPEPAADLPEDRKEAENSGQVNLIDPPAGSDTQAAEEAKKRQAEAEKERREAEKKKAEQERQEKEKAAEDSAENQQNSGQQGSEQQGSEQNGGQNFGQNSGQQGADAP